MNNTEIISLHKIIGSSQRQMVLPILYCQYVTSKEEMIVMYSVQTQNKKQNKKASQKYIRKPSFFSFIRSATSHWLLQDFLLSLKKDFIVAHHIQGHSILTALLSQYNYKITIMSIFYKNFSVLIQIRNFARF